VKPGPELCRPADASPDDIRHGLPQLLRYWLDLVFILSELVMTKDVAAELQGGLCRHLLI
jgi:hypothetical protein